MRYSKCAKTLNEGKQILDEKDFEFIRVFEFLTRAGLLWYSCRLRQLESVRESFEEDPENLVRQGIGILEAVPFTPSNEN